jgi:tetratricopeptide (TPR) repeat protein
MRASVTGHVGAAIRSHEAALAAWEEAGDARNAALTRSTMGSLQGELGAYEEAELSLRRALTAAERMNLSNVEGWSLANLGRVLGRLNRGKEARAALERAVAIGEARRGVRLEIASRLYLADVLRAGGDISRASKEAERALDLAVNMPPLAALAGAMLARVLLDRREIEAALATAARAMQVLETIDAVEGDYFIRLVHAACLVGAERSDQARAALVKAKEHLLSRAAKLEDESLKRSLFERVQENADTLELAARFGV